MSVTIGLGLRAVVQALIFVIISRTLGIRDYGAFAATFALASIFGSLGALGTQTVMLQEVSLEVSGFASAWGKTLSTIAISTPVMLLVYLLLAWWILPVEISPAVIVLIGIAEIVLTPVVSSTIPAYQGHERMGRAAQLTLLPVVPRCVAAILLSLLASVSASDALLVIWAAFYAVSALSAAIYAQRLTARELGSGRRPALSEVWLTIRRGLPFAASSAVLKVHTDIDKTILSRLATLESTGGYSAGHRVIDLVAVPIVSLLSAIWPRFFRAGSRSTQDIFKLAIRILPVPAVYAVLAGSGIYYCADLLPALLGSGYSVASDVLRWLAWLPLISLPRLLLQMIMFSSNRQVAALSALTFGAAINIGLNLWLIPDYGWKGAAVSTYAAEILVILAMLYHLKQQTAAGSWTNQQF